MNILRLLRPKYYNVLTRILVVGGLALLSKPIWIDILNLFLSEYGFSVIGEYDWLLGLSVILIALSYNTVHRYLDLKYERPNQPAFNNTEIKSKSDFGELCRAILPLLKDNEYIFKTTGPNSGSNNVGDLRKDLTMWEELKKKVIKPNNEAIKQLINKNKNIIPSSLMDIFNEMVFHIEAFNKHIENPNFDYSEFQFPKQFPDVIMNTCFENSKYDDDLKKIIKWIDKKVSKIKSSNWFLFGSTVLTPKDSADVDLAVLLADMANLDKVNGKLSELKFDFKLKFRKPLHVSIFEQSNNIDFREFKEKNPLKIENQNG